MESELELCVELRALLRSSPPRTAQYKYLHRILHYLLAPDKPAQGHVYIVAVDGDGGTTVWDKPVVVN